VTAASKIILGNIIDLEMMKKKKNIYGYKTLGKPCFPLVT